MQHVSISFNRRVHESLKAVLAHRVHQVKLTSCMWLQVFGLSILRGKSSPGMTLLNLRFRDELSDGLTASAATSTPSPSGSGAQTMGCQQ